MIANIITDLKKVETFGFVNITPDASTININIPTLIIGKQKAEEIFGKKKVRMLDRHIEGKVWWTYSRLDRRDEYERDIEIFNRNVMQYIENGVKYTSFNIFASSYETIKRLIRFIYGEKDKYIYLTENEIYIYNNGIVVGLSLDELRYCGINIEKMTGKIFSNPHNIRVYNRFKDTKAMTNITKKANYLTPYLYFLNR